MRTTLGCVGLLVFLAGCASAPKATARAEARPVQLASASLEVAEQTLSELSLRLEARLNGAPGARVSAVRYEWVADGKVVFATEAPLDIVLAEGESLVSFEAKGAPPTEPERSLIALRGDLVVQDGGAQTLVPFAQSLEVRPPRPLHVRLKDYDAGRYSRDEAVIVFYVGVDNPNPFSVRLGSLRFQAEIDGKLLEQGTIGHADPIAPNSTGLYEVQVGLRKDTWGPETRRLLASGKVPWKIHGQVVVGADVQPFSISGEIRIGSAR